MASIQEQLAAFQEELRVLERNESLRTSSAKRFIPNSDYVETRNELQQKISILSKAVLEDSVSKTKSKPNIPSEPTNTNQSVESKDNTLRNILLAGGALLLLG
jgi:hypothetical protein